MRKVVATMNMTLDGYCDHTSGIADLELHQYYADLLKNGGAVLYGRTTYQLMEDYWPSVVQNPTGEKETDDFALTLENIPKMVFSRTLKSVGWKNVTLATRALEEEVASLKQQEGRDILVGSPSLISALTKSKLIDEFKLCIHPVIAGKGLVLFKAVPELMYLKRVSLREMGSGTLAITYLPS